MAETALIRAENIRQIGLAAPAAFEENGLSRDRCLEAGRSLLAKAEAEGMSDDLDRSIAVFIEKARKTVRKMNGKRSPVTILFDDIRSEFTKMEAEVDPAKHNSIPWQLQQLRNDYAAKKREEAEARRRAEAEKQQREQDRKRIKAEIQQVFLRMFREYCKKVSDTLTSAADYVTLGTYDATVKSIGEYGTALSEDFADGPVVVQTWPQGFTNDDMGAIRAEVFREMLPGFRETFTGEITALKESLLEKLPSTKAHLEKMASADAGEAKKMKEQLERRQQEEQRRREEEQRRAGEEQARAIEAERQAAEMDNIFTQTAARQQTYQPKTKVTKRIQLLNPEGILPIVSTWFSREGSSLSVEELSKMFKRQITFCEKLAKEGEFIRDESIDYVDEVKAK